MVELVGAMPILSSIRFVKNPLFQSVTLRGVLMESLLTHLHGEILPLEIKSFY